MHQPDPGSVLVLVGVAASVAFGLALLRRSSLRGAPFVLGLLAALWGAQLALVQAALFLHDAAWTPRLALASVAFILPLPMLLLHFAAIFPTRLPMTLRPWWPAAAAAPSLAALVAVLALPGAGMNAQNALLFGWAPVLLLYLPFLAALLLAFARFAAGLRKATAPVERAQLHLAALGVGAYLAGSLTEGLYLRTVFLDQNVPRLGEAGALAFAGATLAALLATLALAAWAAARSPPPERRALAAVLGVAVGATLAAQLADGFVVGLWRVAMVGLLWYAVSKYRLFDLDLRLRTTARPWLAATAGALAGATVLAAAGPALLRLAPGPAVVALAALAGVAAGLLAHRRLGPALDERFPYVRATAEYVRRRKLEVYRAAVEGGAQREDLDRLARDLALPHAERGILERLAATRAAPPATADAGTFAGGRYRVERFLGPGVYGRVSVAWDARVGERVVLKEYAGFGGPAARDAFAREARTLGALEHRHVIAVRDVFREGEDMVLVLEHAPDGSLADRLQKGPVGPEEALDVAAQLLEGLAAAHKAGIVHRDVKPENVLLKGGVVKLADFGVAFDPVLDGALRAAAASPGTLAWMAPEQALGQGASRASDVYAAGLVLHALLAGRPPVRVEGLDEHAARRAVAAAAPLPVPEGLPPAAAAALARALARDPADRFPDAAAMLAALRPRAALPAFREARPGQTERAYGIG